MISDKPVRETTADYIFHSFPSYREITSPDQAVQVLNPYYQRSGTLFLTLRSDGVVAFSGYVFLLPSRKLANKLLVKGV